MDIGSVWIGSETFFSLFGLGDFEPGPGHVGSIEECFEYGRLLQDFGVTHIAYLIETEDCRLYDSWDQECSAIGGPRQAPENCQSSTAAPATTTAGPATTTAAPTTTTAKPPTTTAVPATTTAAAATTAAVDIAGASGAAPAKGAGDIEGGGGAAVNDDVASMQKWL